MFYSGEFHPFRLPVVGLWLDIFQKIKALGFNGVSFYVNWGLVEADPGQVRFDGIFGLQDFFSAASEAGIYLIAAQDHTSMLKSLPAVSRAGSSD